MLPGKASYLVIQLTVPYQFFAVLTGGQDGADFSLSQTVCEGFLTSWPSPWPPCCPLFQPMPQLPRPPRNPKRSRSSLPPQPRPYWWPPLPTAPLSASPAATPATRCASARRWLAKPSTSISGTPRTAATTALETPATAARLSSNRSFPESTRYWSTPTRRTARQTGRSRTLSFPSAQPQHPRRKPATVPGRDIPPGQEQSETLT